MLAMQARAIVPCIGCSCSHVVGCVAFLLVLPVFFSLFVSSGYGGHVSHAQFQFGRSYGPITADCLQKFPANRSGEFDTTRLAQSQPIAARY